MPTVATSKGSPVLAEPHPEHLRNLVLNYLCHNCYLSTAEAFARDSAVRHLDKDGDEILPHVNAEASGNGLLSSHGTAGSPQTFPAELPMDTVRHILIRQRIQFEILSGNVRGATHLLNRHFPQVLNGRLDDTGGASEGVMDIADEHVNHHPERLEYVAETVDPTHLSFNLRILAFIEACRTVPLAYPPVASSFPSPSGRAGYTDCSGSPDTDADTDTDDVVMDAASEEDEHSAEQIVSMRKLYSMVDTLRKPEDRAIYKQELTNVAGILAYKKPETSPMARYLHQERRDRVAEQINSAILYHTGMPSVSYLERAVRYTHCLWAMLHELRAKVPATQRPGGVSLPLSAGARETDKEAFYEARPFDLQLLLNTKT